MQKQAPLLAGIVVATFAAGFFSGRASVEQGQTPSAPTAAAPAPPAAPPAFGGMPRFSPVPAQAPAAAAAAAPTENVTGAIAEVIQVPNFTYLRLSTASGDQWAAVAAKEGLAVGQQATIVNAMLMENFASKTLNRSFERIWFGELGK